MESICKHPVQIHGLCAVCGADLSTFEDENGYYDATAPEEFLGSTLSANTSNTSLHHVLHTAPFLKVTAEEANRIAKETRDRLLGSMKLSLVVDLDQTVLHATVDPSVQEWLQDSQHPIHKHAQDIHPIALHDSAHLYFIKLRPGLTEFFAQLSKLYEMHIYTMGSRSYAHAIVKLFDPDGQLFQDRILTRDDNEIIQNRKELTRIFPTDDRMVVVIDDRNDVWPKNCANLVQVHPYCFFVGAGDVNNPFANSTTDLDREAGVLEEPVRQNEVITNVDDNELSVVQRVLIDIHDLFYNPSRQQQFPEGMPDVKSILTDYKQSIFKGMRFAFSGIFNRNLPVAEQRLWQQCIMFGAACDVEIVQDLTTHLVTPRTDTEKVLEASELNLVIVHPDWILESIRAWKLQPIDSFLITPVKRTKRPHHADSAARGKRAKFGEYDEKEQYDETAVDVSLDQNDLEEADRELADLLAEDEADASGTDEGVEEDFDENAEVLDYEGSQASSTGASATLASLEDEFFE